VYICDDIHLYDDIYIVLCTCPVLSCPQVQTWEGGVRGVGFVRGTNSALAKVKAGVSSVQLMHSRFKIKNASFWSHCILKVIILFTKTGSGQTLQGKH
jgi:hypothetical protein